MRKYPMCLHAITRGGVLLVGLALFGLLLSGCATRPVTSPSAAANAASDAAVSYRRELPGGEGQHQLLRGQSLTQLPGPLPNNRLPEYPSRWLARSLPAIELSVLFSVDGEGGISELQVADPEPADACDACAEDFRSSLREALQHWKFHPMQIHGWIDGPDQDGDGQPDSVNRGVVEVRPYSLRLRFRFEVQDGQALVTRSSP